MTRSVLDLIREVGYQESSQSNFIVFAKQQQSQTVDSVNGLIRKFRFRPYNEDGFYKFYVRNNRVSRRVPLDIDDPEVYDYLRGLRRINMIACRPIDGSNWLAIPENNETASHLGIIGSQIISNCECEYFDHIICAITQDGHLVYLENDFSFTNTLVDEMRERFLEAKENLQTEIGVCVVNIHKDALDIAMQEITTLIEEREAEQRRQRAERIRRMRETVQGRIELALQQTGARLHRCIPRRDLVEITWSTPGRRSRYNSVLNINNLNVVNAGICLQGQDRIFDLTSLVGVVSEGEDRGLIHITR